MMIDRLNKFYSIPILGDISKWIRFVRFAMWDVVISRRIHESLFISLNIKVKEADM